MNEEKLKGVSLINFYFDDYFEGKIIMVPLDKPVKIKKSRLCAESTINYVCTFEGKQKLWGELH